MKSFFKRIVGFIPILRQYLYFRSIYYEVPSFVHFILFQIKKKRIYWPTHKYSCVRGNIIIGKCSRVGHRPGCYIQGRGKVFIGDYVGIAPNCIIISGNHGLLHHSEVVAKETIIGDHCWIASSCNILAGVVLGPRTIVGAGSVVTKSFPEGFCVIAGNPAKIIKHIPKDEFIPEHYEHEFYGYIPASKFKRFYDKYLSGIYFDYDLTKVTLNPIFKDNIRCSSIQ